MSPDPKEILKLFPLSARDCRLLSWKGKKAVWHVKTDQGAKILKKSPASEPRLRFLCQAVRHLRANGAPVPALVRARDGTDYVRLGEACYTLTDAVDGRSPEYGSPSELRRIMRTLGRFHLASRGFQGSGDGEERSHLGRWAEGYRKHLEDLEAFRRQARAAASPFDKLYLKHADEFIRQGREALETLNGDAYREWVAKIDRIKNLCHQDFASGNLILNADGIHVIDMDSLTYDLPARDLRKIFNKVMKKSGWNESKAAVMLQAYHAAHPLNESEYRVVKTDLLFPHLFYGISSKFFGRRMESGWKDETALEKLKTMIRAETSKMEVLNRWDAIVRLAGEGKRA
ncbi:CotS family spore coat protein [Cohnella candidum]|uniref:CotS family spore coat protein n=1 Tax=Cohnella candidum TaxID=2674991 RepID=A0A3G3JY95_9BACL|nr:CotS family spore coat protein [Cohnella candidum]AYQ73163.1 CotS family spore coat protein [Cohnella candidum]